MKKEKTETIVSTPSDVFNVGDKVQYKWHTPGFTDFDGLDKPFLTVEEVQQRKGKPDILFFEGVRSGYLASGFKMFEPKSEANRGEGEKTPATPEPLTPPKPPGQHPYKKFSADDKKYAAATIDVLDERISDLFAYATELNNVENVGEKMGAILPGIIQHVENKIVRIKELKRWLLETFQVK